MDIYVDGDWKVHVIKFGYHIAIDDMTYIFQDKYKAYTDKDAGPIDQQ